MVLMVGNMINFFIDCTRTNTTIYIVIIFFFCLSSIVTTLFFIIYQKNKKKSNLRLKMIACEILMLNCFCMLLINLLFTWQIAIPLSLITLLLINKEKNVCYELETEKQLSEKILKNRSSITNPIYINFYFLALISITISIICHVSINYSGV